MLLKTMSTTHYLTLNGGDLIYLSKKNILKLASNDNAISELNELHDLIKGSGDDWMHDPDVNVLAYKLKFTLEELG